MTKQPIRYHPLTKDLANHLASLDAMIYVFECSKKRREKKEKIGKFENKVIALTRKKKND